MWRQVVASVVLALSLGSAATFAAEDADLPATGTFRSASSLAEGRIYHTATLLPDGHVLVVGGGGLDHEVLSSAEVWDPATGTFGPAGLLAEARMTHTASLLAGSRVLVVGGLDPVASDASLNSAEVWDPATASFSPAGSLAEARVFHTATALMDGRILVVGGSDRDDVFASAEVWDPATASFSPAGSLAEARLNHTSTLLPDGRVLIVGGWGHSAIARAEVWDPATTSFSPAGSLVETRGTHSATRLLDGRVLVVGGRDLFADDVIALAEVWDPVAASFSPAGSLAEPRREHTATPLPDGRVIVVGGWDPGTNMAAPASAEVWLPATASFGPAGSLVWSRFAHTSTLLPDGRILVIGGALFGGLDSVEIWEPGDG